MTRHAVTIPTIVFSSLCGLWIYLVVASVFRWINPIWWGGEEILLLYLGSISVILSVLLFYLIVVKLLTNSTFIQSVSLVKLVLIASIIGITFFPFVEIIARIKNMFHFWESLNPFIAITLAFTMAGILCVLTGIAIILISKSKSRTNMVNLFINLLCV